MLKQKPISTPDIYISEDDEATVVKGAATTSVVAEATAVEDAALVFEDAAPAIGDAEVGAEGATLASDQIEAQVQPPKTEDIVQDDVQEPSGVQGQLQFDVEGAGVVAIDQTEVS